VSLADKHEIISLDDMWVNAQAFLFDSPVYCIEASSLSSILPDRSCFYGDLTNFTRGDGFQSLLIFPSPSANEEVQANPYDAKKTNILTRNLHSIAL
jgi:hypothetical protein